MKKKGKCGLMGMGGFEEGVNQTGNVHGWFRFLDWNFVI